MPTEEDEITVWMNQLDDQSSQAARKIWEHYYEKLIRYASRKLGDAPRRMVDEEDIVVSAMHSLHRGLRDGRFPDFASRDDLWRILLTITSNKAKKSIRREMTQKRGGGAIRGESIFVRANEDGPGIAGMAGTEPTPEFAEMVSVECDDLIEQLGDPGLKKVSLMKLQGFTNEEIAAEMGSSVRSVERKLARIRLVWADAT